MKEKRNLLSTAAMRMGRNSDWLGVKCQTCNREQQKHNYCTPWVVTTGLYTELAKVLKAADRSEIAAWLE